MRSGIDGPYGKGLFFEGDLQQPRVRQVPQLVGCVTSSGEREGCSCTEVTERSPEPSISLCGTGLPQETRHRLFAFSARPRILCLRMSPLPKDLIITLHLTQTSSSSKVSLKTKQKREFLGDMAHDGEYRLTSACCGISQSAVWGTLVTVRCWYLFHYTNKQQIQNKNLC